jgi:uncharacterized protein DUF4129
LKRGLPGRLWLINLGCLAAFLAGPLCWIDPGEASDALRNDASALKACIASRSIAEDEEDDQHRFKLSDHCPHVISTLTKIPAKDLFDKALGDETTLDQLRDIAALFDSYHATSKDNQRLDYKGLHGLLASTLVSSPKPKTAWWHQLMEWLREWLKRKLTENGNNDVRWLIELFQWLTPSKTIVNLMFKSTIILILVLAIIVVANGMHTFDLRSWRLRRKTTRFEIEDPSAQARQANVSWEEVLRLPPGSQPTALLRFVIGILIERGLLPNNHSLTNRELLRRLHAEDPTKAESFQCLMVHAESTLYGDQSIAPGQVQGLFHTAHALVGQPIHPSMS